MARGLDGIAAAVYFCYGAIGAEYLKKVFTGSFGLRFLVQLTEQVKGHP
ncbi:hypothetical protein F4694_001272 [Bacillus niacini]|uniref:Uncharacterized protein n=1 Tax=Neobacillus niacini TaxID=86668 RepID=A0A852TAM4_9BACI|nr:hypothetical protein [Neobacillus niacini]NYE04528.1 hypothetical protein [Neobacillus niacini]